MPWFKMVQSFLGNVMNNISSHIMAFGTRKKQTNGMNDAYRQGKGTDMTRWMPTDKQNLAELGLTIAVYVNVHPN